MELVALLRALWRRRRLAAVGLGVAVCIAFLASRGETTTVGVASKRVVLDTVNSQLVDAEPVGADTLAWRAALLADLMGGDAGGPRIADQLGVPERDIAIFAPYLNEPAKATPLSDRATEAAATTTEPYVVAIQAAEPLPIIRIDATAPDGDEAIRLAEAAADALKAASAAHVDTADLLAFVVEDVGPVRARTITEGPRRIVAGVLALMFFTLWCIGVVVYGAMSVRRGGTPARRPRRTVQRRPA
jgi:hypothetical protein